MKINFLKSAILRNRRRFGVALLVLLISTWFALTPGAAQSRKRITYIQVGEVSEGSRVTLVSDSPLNDYEAFRRGDRFYVRIPFADFTAGQPHFRGDGFEDVQVQKVGDSVVVSFKLQPGATARVDQRSTRLDVIFSAPNRMARSNRTNAESNRGTYIPADGIVRVRNPQTPQHRDRDAAGPIPPGSPGSPQATRERLVTGRVSDFQTPYRQPAANPREFANRRVGNRLAGNSSASESERSSNVSKHETSSGMSKSEPSLSISKPEPSPALVPSTSPRYPALATSTPAAPGGSQPAVKSPVGVSQNSKSWSDIARQWISANRQASLLGGLLLLCLLVFLAVLLFRRRRIVVKAKRARTTLAQPKHSPDVARNSPAVGAPANSPLAAPVASANAPRTSGIQENAERGNFVPQPAMARSAAVAAPQNQAWAPASPATGSSGDEDQEREVFEL